MNQLEPDKHYVLPQGGGGVWVTVDNVSIWIRRRDEGVTVSLHPLGHETDGELDYCSVKFDRSKALGQKIWDDLHLNKPPAPEPVKHHVVLRPHVVNKPGTWRNKPFFKKR